MKACSKYKKGLALLSAGVLEGTERSTLQSHVATCPGCQRYLHELTEISRQHSDLVDSHRSAELSENWHERLVQRMQALESESRGGLHSTRASAPRIFRWPFAIPTALAAGITLLFLLRPSPDPRPGRLTSPPNVLPTVVINSPDFTPTLLSYQRALRESPEALDALLNEEAGVSGPPSVHVTAVSWKSALLTE